MTSHERQKPGSEAAEFVRHARKPSPGFLREIFDFLRSGGRGWLAPIILALLLIGALVMLGGTSAAPFIYTLF